MQVVLVMFKADGERRSFSLPRSVTVIGRREDCDLRIPLGEVSRKHCRLIVDGDVLRLEDLGSSNGTYHNGVRIQEAVIDPGDTLQVGPVMFVVQIDGEPADEEIQPPVEAQATAQPGVDIDEDLPRFQDDNDDFLEETEQTRNEDVVIDLDLEEIDEDKGNA